MASTKKRSRPALLVDGAPPGIRFNFIRNDGKAQHLIWLVQMKTIFSTQLPKMPPQYIVRLVFDRKHETLLMLKENEVTLGGTTETVSTVVGGVAFRVFDSQRFAEIAFLAISADHQVRGYGTRVMNRLKCEMQKRGVTHFLTYADNYAIGYFEKQGFVKQLTMPRTRWHGFIKDYDGGTLMECFIHPKIDYLRIPAMLETQREHLRARISKICGASIVYKGLNAEERRKYATDPYSLPGVKEAGWVRPAPSTASDGAGTAGDPASGRRPSMLEAMATLIHDLKRQRFSWPFRQPVDAVLVPGYDQIITDPVDLSLIESRLEKSLYTTKAQLRADIVRMCDNCRVFNKGTQYERLADQLQQYAEPRIKIIPTDAPSALST